MSVALLAFPRRWLFSALVMSATIAVDLDHLLADPLYDPLRCSIGFHPLHAFLPVLAYLLLCFVPRPPWIRLIGLGLVIHMLLDASDCLGMPGGIAALRGFLPFA